MHGQKKRARLDGTHAVQRAALVVGGGATSDDPAVSKACRAASNYHQAYNNAPSVVFVVAVWAWMRTQPREPERSQKTHRRRTDGVSPLRRFGSNNRNLLNPIR